MAQSNLLSSKFSSLFFLPPEVSDNKLGVDEENKPPNNLVAFFQ